MSPDYYNCTCSLFDFHINLHAGLTGKKYQSGDHGLGKDEEMILEGIEMQVEERKSSQASEISISWRGTCIVTLNFFLSFWVKLSQK